MRARAMDDDEGVPPLLLALIGAMTAIELLLSAADRGLLGATDWRQIALIHGAFWQPVMDGTARPAFSGQAITMFASYAFLHGGLLHLAMNAVILLSLGKFVAQRAGQWAMLLLFLVSAVAGGLTFGLLSRGAGPMIGASGAVFGFLGLWQYWEAATRRRLRASLQPVLATIGTLIAINVAMAVFMGGALAWQAHLGGFLAGVALGPLMTGFARRRAMRR